VLFAAGAVAVGSTLASFSAETDNNTSTFAGGWIGTASSLAATPSGTDASLTWTPATHGLNGQALWKWDAGSGSSCAPTTTLNGGISNSVTSVTVSSASGFPTSGNFTIQVDSEQMTVTAGQGTTTWTVTRGANSTTAASHNSGATVSRVTSYSLNHTLATAQTASYTSTSPTVTTLAAAVGSTTLGAAITTTSATSITVSLATSFPAVPFVIQVDSEQMNVTAESGAGNKTWTVTRGYNSTTAATHATAAPVNQVSVSVASASAFPGSGSYGIQIDGEQMTVTSGQGTTAWLVTRGVGSTQALSHASGAVVAQTSDPVSGHFLCYELVSTSASNWTATSSPSGLQVGLVLTGLVVTNSGTANSLTSGDTVKITFNQAQSTIAAVGSNTAEVCEIWDGSTPSNMTVYFDHVAYGTGNACTSGITPNYDVALSGLTITHAVAGSATVLAQDALSGNSVTWTLKAAGKALTGQATITGTASQQVDSTNGGTDVGAACTSATYNCTQVATGTKF